MSMIKKTLGTTLYDSDIAQSLRRWLLSMSKDVDEIYYRVEPPSEDRKPEKPSVSLPLPVNALSSPPPISTAHNLVLLPSTDLGHGPASIIEDRPVTPLHIVRTIVCHKLKKQIGDILWSNTIKSLVGGECPSDSW